jgi:hypothetical protein
MTYRLTVLAAVGGMLLAGSAATVSAAGSQCVVQQVDERGAVVATSMQAEGTQYGRFRCAGGQWELVRARGAEGVLVARELQVDPAGVVSVRRLVGASLGYHLTMAEMAEVFQAITGDRDVVVGRAVVAENDGRQRTEAEIEALLAGRDGTGARVLRTLDRPSLDLTTDDIIGATGGTPENTVVYFSIWGAIKRAVAWVVDQVRDAADWVENHCDWGTDPDGIFVVCRW